MYVQKPRPANDWVRPLIGVVVFIGSFVVIGLMIGWYLDRPIVYHVDGECQRVETPQGMKPCSAFKREELSRFNWEHSAPKKP